MKIAVVVPVLGGATGGIKAAAMLASQLAECGHEVYMLACEKTNKQFFELDSRVVPSIIGEIYRNTKQNLVTLDNESYFVEVDDHFRQYRQKYRYNEDLLYNDLTVLQPDGVISVLFQSHFFCIPAATRAGIPIIASEHNSPKSYHEHWWMSQDELDYLYHLLTFTRKIHLLSEIYKEGYPSSLHSKMVYISNAVDTVVNSASLVNQSRKKTIIAVGELSKWKNYEALVDSFALISRDFPEWTLNIFGEGPEEGTLVRKIAKHPELRGRVLLKGAVPHSTIIEELLSSKIFCHPSLAESFGFVVAEGMSAGLPAVGVAETDGVNVLIKNGYNGFLVQSDNLVEGMADRLRALMSDPILLDTLSANAVNSVQYLSSDHVMYTWNQVVQATYEPSIQRRQQTNAGSPTVNGSRYATHYKITVNLMLNPYQIKDMLKHKLQGTFLLGPAKALYTFIKIVFRTMKRIVRYNPNSNRTNDGTNS